MFHLNGGPHHGTMLIGAPATNWISFGGAIYEALAHHDDNRTISMSHAPDVCIHT